MNQEEIKERIFKAIADSHSQREASTIARWISEDWSRLREEEYPDHTGETLLREIVHRLRNDEPVQYILRRAHFYGYPLYVDQTVLIPRPETEELVEWILKTEQGPATLRVLDVGTGSGCIGLTLARERPNWTVELLDIAQKNLEVARKNAEQLDVSVQISKGNILTEQADEASIDLIASNPPYIHEDEWEKLQSRITGYEPREALVAEGDALVFYRALASYATDALNRHGTLYVECHEMKTKQVMEVFGATDGLSSIERRRDLQGQWRMVRAEKC